MKLFSSIILIALSVLFSNCGKNPVLIKEHQLVNDIFYAENSLKPFSGDCRLNYFDSENVKMLMSFKDGKMHGQVTVFYPDGAVKTTGTYKNGLQSGKWETRYNNGQLHYTVCFSNDTLQGSYAEYSPQGKLIDTGVYRENNRNT